MFMLVSKSIPVSKRGPLCPEIRRWETWEIIMMRITTSCCTLGADAISLNSNQNTSVFHSWKLIKLSWKCRPLCSGVDISKAHNLCQEKHLCTSRPISWNRCNCDSESQRSFISVCSCKKVLMKSVFTKGCIIIIMRFLWDSHWK